MMHLGLAGRGFFLGAVIVALCACAVDAPAPADPPPAPMSALGSYLAARQAQQDHDYAAAAQFIERALAGDPNNSDLIRRSFVLRVSEGKVAEAAPLAKRLVDFDGNGGLPSLVLAVEDIKAGDFDGAAKLAQDMPREGAQRFAVPLLLAWIELGRGHPAPALQALDQISGLAGMEPLRQLHTALILDNADRIDEAQAAYEKLLKQEGHPSWRTVELAGNFFERHGRTEEARRLYRSFAADDPDTEAAAQGLARIEKGELPPRLVATPRAGAAEALFDLAGLLDQRDTIDAALIYARLSLELQPDFALAQLLTGEIREDQDHTEDAIALYRAVDKASPLARSAQLKAAFALDSLGRTDEAIAALRAMAAAEPKQPEALIAIGDILRGHDRFAEAVQAYDAAIARLGKPDAASWRVFYSRGVALERSGQWPRAEADLEHALKLQPEQPLVLNYLGYSWIDKGAHLDEALKMVQRAVELRPNDGYIVDSLGWAFYRLGDFSHATEFLERAIELLPEDPTINDHLGDVYWRTGRLAEARFQWHRALQFKPEAEEVKSIETKLDRGLDKAATTVSGG